MNRHVLQRRIRTARSRYGLLGGLVIGILSLSDGSRLVAQHPTVAVHMSGDVSADELLARRVTMHLTNVSLKRAVDSVSRLAGVIVEYRLPLLTAHSEPVTVNVRGVSLGIVLEQLLNGTTLRVVSGGPGRLTIVSGDANVTDSVNAMGTVSGRVVDSASRRGLSGATVKLAGTKLGTVTTDSGRFVLRDVPVGEYVLAVKSFSYRPTERNITVTANTPAIVRIAMVSAPNVLAGMVTTATGIQRKIEVGNDITTINADSLMNVAPITSVTDILEGRVPGLTVMHTSGTPGDPSRIRIRGSGSINSNSDPILIVDGVRVYASQSDERNASLAPGKLGGSSASLGIPDYATPSPLDQIDPNSIQTIEVFKGPSASAMYGSDAANGVIVITTKRGQSGPTHWDLNLGAGLSYQPRDWPVNYYRFGYGPQSSSRGSPFCAWNDLSCTQDSIVAYQALNDPGYNVFADHGSNQSGALTISGGVPTLRYSLTASGGGILGILKMPGLEQQRFLSQYGYAMPTWMVRPDRYNTFGGSGQLTAQPSATATITLVSSLYNSMQQRSSLEQAPLQLEAQYINPLLLGATALIQREYERATSSNLTTTNAVTASWAPVPWLPLVATGGLNTGQRVDKTYVPYGIFDNARTSYPDSTGSYGLGRGTTLDKTVTVGTTVPLPGLSLGVGGNYHAGSTNDFSAYTNQLAPGVSNPSTFPVNLNGGNQFTQSSADAATYGWYIEPRLNFASKLFVTPGFRLDGNSTSGTHGGFSGSGLTGLPKLNLSYVMVDRADDPLWGVVNLFRPRLALGVAGTQPQPTDKLRLYARTEGSNTINLNGSLVSVTFLSALGNTQLQPERSRELEGGFETDLWNNRLGLTYTRYDKVRHNAILSVPVATSVYGDNQFYSVNIGEIRNTGTELTVNAKLLQSRAIGWNVGLDFSHVNEVLVKLRPGQSAVTFGGTGGGYETRLVEGYPLWGRWARPILSYSDANQDGILSPSEVRYGDSLVYLGPQNSPTTMGMQTDVALFGGTLGLHASVVYEGGFAQVNQASISSGAFSQLGNAPGTTLATQAAIVAATFGDDIGFVQTVSVLRFQGLSINYQMPRAFSRRLSIPHITVALQGSNLGLHTNYRGLDPSVNAFSTVGSAGQQLVDSGQLPAPRTWSLHVTLGN